MLLREVWRELPDVSNCHEDHHHFVALLDGKWLRNIYISASTRFPSSGVSLRLPKRFLLDFSSDAVVEEMLPRVLWSASAQPVFVILS
jgi:hypothetical protein